MSLTLIVCSLLALLSAWFLVVPHSSEETSQSASSVDARRRALLEEKERLIQIIRDLELDHATQKLSDEEFTIMNNRLRYDLVETLKKLE